MYRWFYSLVIGVVSCGFCQEVFDQTLEERCLRNLKQLTFSSMGFERAGEAYFSPDDKCIIFQAVPEGKRSFQIFVMSLEDMQPMLVSTGKGACTCANFRADGKKIIFASSHSDPDLAEHDQQLSSNGQYKWDLTAYMNIYEANLDGSDLCALTSGPAYHAECSYSYTGAEIVYASNEDGFMNLYVMKADGSEVRQITHTKHCYNGGPFFSPDDQRVLFRADRDKPNYLQLFVTNTDGTDERQLTDNGAVNWAPYWHPNGKVVAYTTSLHGHQHYEIYLLNIDSGQEYRLTHNPSFDGLAVFNRTGDKLMWTSKRGDQTSQIFIADFVLPTEME